MFRNSILGMLAAALLVQSSYGEELGGFGLTGLTPLADAEANAVRGEGMDSIALAASQIFVFDYGSGTSLNFQASSVNSNLNVNLDVTETLEDSSGASISTISAHGLAHSRSVSMTSCSLPKWSTSTRLVRPE